MTNRYALTMDKPNSWTVFDVFSGQPAEFKQKPTVARCFAATRRFTYSHWRRGPPSKGW
ncbi:MULTISPECIES: hypothetical protein [unclassified Mesorhizobium]|uniref:hypothetical protein n=1 Tax=unclassified Mesorhizobium TaxID=325217 RepID=UPI0015E2C9D2|nr:MULTISPECIES: hypothetical protein [unclassified Mesorhizobium]